MQVFLQMENRPKKFLQNTSKSEESMSFFYRLLKFGKSIEDVVIQFP